MLIKEYRIVLPFSVEEYQVGQLYAVAEASKNETGGGDGVEVLVNDKYEKDGEKGQYTHKIYHLQSKVPKVIRMMAPKGSLELHEKAWNAYPYCRTILTSEYLKDRFEIRIETWHKPDMGNEPNIHQLDDNTLKQREVVNIDIAETSRKDPAEEDPTKCQTKKTKRGPLAPDWKDNLATNTECPHMCAYKLVYAEVKMLGIQGKAESFIHDFEKRVFTKFHRQMFCWLDNWIDLTMDDIRQLENDTKAELEKMIMTDELRGSSTE